MGLDVLYCLAFYSVSIYRGPPVPHHFENKSTPYNIQSTQVGIMSGVYYL